MPVRPGSPAAEKRSFSHARDALREQHVVRAGGVAAQLADAGVIPRASANQIAAMQLDPVPPAPGLARKFVATHLDAATAAQREAAVLLASEIVTSAVLNSRTSMEIGVGCVAGNVYLAVADRDATTADVNPRAVGQLRGRGKTLVTSLADDHGTMRNPRGNTVWIVLREHGRATAAGALGN